MNIIRITTTLALSVALGANAQAQLDKTAEQGKAEAAASICAGSPPANHGSAIKVDEDAAQSQPKEPRPTLKQARRSPSRISTIDPLLPFGE
jgi:hypothetical protein